MEVPRQRDTGRDTRGKERHRNGGQTVRNGGVEMERGTTETETDEMTRRERGRERQGEQRWRERDREKERQREMGWGQIGEPEPDNQGRGSCRGGQGPPRSPSMRLQTALGLQGATGIKLRLGAGVLPSRVGGTWENQQKRGAPALGSLPPHPSRERSGSLCLCLSPRLRVPCAQQPDFCDFTRVTWLILPCPWGKPCPVSAQVHG